MVEVWGGYIRKGYKGLEPHFKSITDYSLITALAVPTQGGELPGMLCKEKKLSRQFLNTKVGIFLPK